MKILSSPFFYNANKYKAINTANQQISFGNQDSQGREKIDDDRKILELFREYTNILPPAFSKYFPKVSPEALNETFIKVAEGEFTKAVPELEAAIKYIDTIGELRAAKEKPGTNAVNRQDEANYLLLKGILEIKLAGSYEAIASTERDRIYQTPTFDAEVYRNRIKSMYIPKYDLTIPEKLFIESHEHYAKAKVAFNKLNKDINLENTDSKLSLLGEFTSLEGLNSTHFRLMGIANLFHLSKAQRTVYNNIRRQAEEIENKLIALGVTEKEMLKAFVDTSIPQDLRSGKIIPSMERCPLSAKDWLDSDRLLAQLYRKGGRKNPNEANKADYNGIKPSNIEFLTKKPGESEFKP